MKRRPDQIREGAEYSERTEETLPGLLKRMRVWMWMRRARRLYRSGRYDHAADWCQAVCELDRDHAPAREFAEEVQRTALADARRGAEADDADLPALIRYVLWLLETKDYREAETQLGRARQIHAASGTQKDNNVELLHLAGRVAYHAGRCEEALGWLEQSRTSSMLAPENWYYTGLCHLARGEEEKALPWFERLAAKLGAAIEDRFHELIELDEADMKGKRK